MKGQLKLDVKVKRFSTPCSGRAASQLKFSGGGQNDCELFYLSTKKLFVFSHSDVIMNSVHGTRNEFSEQKLVFVAPRRCDLFGRLS